MSLPGKRDGKTTATEQDKPAPALRHTKIGDLQYSFCQQVAQGLKMFAQSLVVRLALDHESGDILHHDCSWSNFLGKPGDLQNETISRILPPILGGQTRESLTRWTACKKIDSIHLLLLEKFTPGNSCNVLLYAADFRVIEPIGRECTRFQLNGCHHPKTTAL